jgi:hypothetical protein
MTRITLSIELDEHQAEAYLRWLVSQYEVAMADCWYSDRYRYVAEGLRAPRVLQDHPHIAGISRTARELKALLKGVQA